MFCIERGPTCHNLNETLSPFTPLFRSLVARGIVDPGSVGITGLSDGSSTVQFASLNCSKFAAGIVSGCCWEKEQAAWLGPAFTRRLTAIGWPGMTTNAPSFWDRMSRSEEHTSELQSLMRISYAVFCLK